MSAFGKTATAAAKKLKEQSDYYSANRAELGNFGPATRAKLTLTNPFTANAPAVSRIASPASSAPQGSTLGSDAKAIKIRQDYEQIPEAEVSRGVRKKKSAS